MKENKLDSTRIKVLSIDEESIKIIKFGINYQRIKIEMINI